MKAHLAKLSLALLSAVFLLGCQEQGSEPVGPEGLGPEFMKVKNCDPGDREVHPSCKPAEDDPNTKVTWSFADLTVHVVPDNASTLQSTCSGTPGAKLSNPTVQWKDGDEDDDNEVGEGENEHCVSVMPEGSAVTLGNDAHLIVATKKGSITVTVQFLIQDIGGPESIQYRTDRFSLDVTGFTGFTGADFTLHLHATDVPIFRLKGHTGGPKDSIVGTINIDDIVYH